MSTSTVDRRKGIPGYDAAGQVKAMGGPIAQRASRKTADRPGFLDLRPESQQQAVDEQAVYRTPVVNRRQQATRSGQRPVQVDMPGDEIVEGDPIAPRVSQKDGPAIIDLRVRSTPRPPTGEVQATTDDLPGTNDDDWTPRRAPREERRQRVAAQRQHAGGDEPRTAPDSRSSRPGRRVHWLVPVFTGMLLLVVFYTVCFWVYTIGLGVSNRVTYGSARTSEITADLGQGDSPANPSYVLASNVAGQIIVTILPGGDSTKARIYEMPALEPSMWGNLSDVVATIEVQHSATPNIEVHLVGDPGYWHFFARPSLTVTLVNTKQGFEVLVGSQ